METSRSVRRRQGSLLGAERGSLFLGDPKRVLPETLVGQIHIARNDRLLLEMPVQVFENTEWRHPVENVRDFSAVELFAISF